MSGIICLLYSLARKEEGKKTQPKALKIDANGGKHAHSVYGAGD